MRCYICDSELSDNEHAVQEDGKPEPCKTCFDIAMDAAFSEFDPEEHMKEDEDDGTVEEH